MLVVGGRWHDFDFVRVQLLQELGGHEVVRTRVFENYANVAAIMAADVLVTYTCDVRPDEAAQRALSSFVARGGRWLALHGTNSAIDPPVSGERRAFTTPRVLGVVADVLGSQFLGHPAIAPYTVRADQPDHPLVRGIPAFETTDELYVSELHPPLTVLLSTRFAGPCPSFADGDTTDDAPRPVLYLKDTGAGTVCYLTLGHARGRLDVQDLGIDDFGRVDRGSWTIPEFCELITRTVAWAVHGDGWRSCAAEAADKSPVVRDVVPAGQA